MPVTTQPTQNARLPPSRWPHTSGRGTGVSIHQQITHDNKTIMHTGRGFYVYDKLRFPHSGFHGGSLDEYDKALKNKSELTGLIVGGYTSRRKFCKLQYRNKIKAVMKQIALATLR
eukprot:6198257-Pleurochrysis_carterae.AAC.2